MAQALININDFEQAAKHLLDSSVYDFICGGANDEVTLKENNDSYNKIKLAPKVLSGVDNPNTTVSLLGQTINTPILIAPMAFQKLAHHRGEMETAIGARLTHTIMLISIFSTTPLANIIPEASLPPWFQLYLLKDRGITKAIIELAQFMGCGALVITVDAPSYGKRERELRNPINCEIAMPDLLEITQKISPTIQLKYAKDISSFLAAAITWSDIEWIKSITKLPILLKGILRCDDASTAVAHGIDGIIISNHGGRQLDTTPPATHALPRILEAVEDKLEILVDGGIRRGVDVLKALALGAKAVLVGRPIMWGLAVDGHKGVHQVLDLLNEELKLAMTLCGCKIISDITDDLIFKIDKI